MTAAKEMSQKQGFVSHPGWENLEHAVLLTDSFEPHEQTVQEMTWHAGFPGVSARTPVKRPVKTPDQILDAMRGNPEITVQELAALLDKSESAVHRAIRKLRVADRLRRTGGAKGGRWEVK